MCLCSTEKFRSVCSFNSTVVIRLVKAIKECHLCIAYCTVHTAAVSGQECHVVGSLDYNTTPITEGQTYILTGYKIQCEGIVIAWEFCYQIQGNVQLTFYPGIWETKSSIGDDITYSLIQLNTVTFTNGSTSGSYLCQNYTLQETERFAVPSESFVGLYSNRGTTRPLLLQTNKNDQSPTYQVHGNQSTITTDSKVNYNIAIRVHLGKLSLSRAHSNRQ